METDIALHSPLPFILSRTYSSYRTENARAGQEPRPQPENACTGYPLTAAAITTLILSDNGGRSLYFEHLFPGEDGYSLRTTHSSWCAVALAKLDEGHRLAALWQALPGENSA